MWDIFDVRECRVCGCTDNQACEGGCSWVEVDLCSAHDPGQGRVMVQNFGNVRVGTGADIGWADLPMEERTADVDAWRAMNESKARTPFVSPIAVALAESRAREAANPAVGDPVEGGPDPETVGSVSPQGPVVPVAGPGVPSSPRRVGKALTAEIAQAYIDGAKVATLAARYGFSRSTIYSGLKRLGVRIRDVRDGIDPAHLVAAFEGGASISSLADRHGVSRAVIEQMLKKAGVDTSRPRPATAGRTLSPEVQAEAIRLYQQGLTAAQVAKQLRISSQSVLRILKQADIPRRAPGRRPSVKAEATS